MPASLKAAAILIAVLLLHPAFLICSRMWGCNAPVARDLIPVGNLTWMVMALIAIRLRWRPGWHLAYYISAILAAICVVSGVIGLLFSFFNWSEWIGTTFVWVLLIGGCLFVVSRLLRTDVAVAYFKK